MTTLFYQISKEHLLYSHFCTFCPNVFGQTLLKEEPVQRDDSDLLISLLVTFILQGSGVAHPNAA